MILKTDQEFKNLIPPLASDERAGLKENLINNGCLDSIKTWNGLIVDGHNRYEICTENNIDFRTDELKFEDRNDAKIWMIRQQIDKRNINDYIRTSLCLKMEDIFKEKAKANMVIASHPDKNEDVALQNSAKQVHEEISQVGVDDNIHVNTHKPPLPNYGIPPQENIKPINTREEIAKAAGVSRDTVAKVKYIEDKGTDEQKEDLAKDKTSIHRVFTELKDKHEPKPEKPIEEPEEETEEEFVDPDHCMFTPFTPTRDLITICPCGCGYGYCETNEVWYTPDEISELEEE